MKTPKVIRAFGYPEFIEKSAPLDYARTEQSFGNASCLSLFHKRHGRLMPGPDVKPLNVSIRRVPRGVSQGISWSRQSVEYRPEHHAKIANPREPGRGSRAARVRLQ
jgi:hypothetical protein